MKTLTQALMVLSSLAVAGAASAQDLQRIGNRTCAVEGTELHDFLSSELPGCDFYCTVDKSVLPEYRDYPGEVFACVERDETAAAVPGSSERGLGAGGLVGLLGLGLLLGAAGGGGGGSTNNTQ